MCRELPNRHIAPTATFQYVLNKRKTKYTLILQDEREAIVEGGKAFPCPWTLVTNKACLLQP